MSQQQFSGDQAKDAADGLDCTDDDIGQPTPSEPTESAPTEPAQPNDPELSPTDPANAPQQDPRE
ncbi:MAG: hypothetical protein V9G04_02250 [Nocardioides sp.]|jgi:hypothetical protein